MKVTNSQSVPRQYIIILADLEDGLQKTLANKDQVKRMHAPNAKSLNRMKQQLKKNNLNYKELLDQYRENPEEFDESEGRINETISNNLNNEMQLCCFRYIMQVYVYVIEILTSSAYVLKFVLVYALALEYIIGRYGAILVEGQTFSLII